MVMMVSMMGMTVMMMGTMVIVLGMENGDDGDFGEGWQHQSTKPC